MRQQREVALAFAAELEVIAHYCRAFTNVFVSGCLLAIAIVALNVALNAPARGGGESWSLDVGTVFGLLLTLALPAVTGYMAWKFWRHRSAGNSCFVSAVLNAGACLGFLSALAYGFVQ